MVKRGLTFFLNGSGESLFFTLRRAAAFSIFCRPEHVAFRVCQICNHTRCPRLFTGCLVSTFQLTSDACSGFYFPSIGVFLTSHPGDYICIRVEWFRFTGLSPDSRLLSLMSVLYWRRILRVSGVSCMVFSFNRAASPPVVSQSRARQMVALSGWVSANAISCS